MPEDKLPAISAVAQQFKEFLNDEYLAGCWRKTLWEDIGWSLLDFPTTASRPLRRVPSWSWAAAADGEVAWGYWKVSYFRILDAGVRSAPGDTTGQNLDGWIRIEGLLVQLDISFVAPFRGFSHTIRLRDVEAGNVVSEFTAFRPDYRFWDDEPDFERQMRRVWCLVLGTSEEPALRVQCIVLREKEDRRERERVFERIGFFVVQQEGGREVWSPPRENWTTLMIV